jgi:hypothetical protein
VEEGFVLIFCPAACASESLVITNGQRLTPLETASWIVTAVRTSYLVTLKFILEK